MAQTIIRRRFINVDGIKTHYLEGGEGPTVVFLHSGEFGGCAELSWEFNLPAFARHFQVVAPDWLGFGRTDKVFDFAEGRSRVFGHIVVLKSWLFMKRILLETQWVEAI